MEQSDNGQVNLSMLWDAGKAVVRGWIIAISSFLKKQNQSSNSFCHATLLGHQLNGSLNRFIFLLGPKLFKM